jgi:transglutaminase-like putative cysteine protease
MPSLQPATSAATWHREPYPGDSRRASARLVPHALAPWRPWTSAASFAAVGLYEAVILGAGWRARSGRPWRISNAALNVLAVAYIAWFFLETRALHFGLVRTASNLLLFTAAAKFVSLKSRREENMALLLCFFLALDSASTATHVVSLLYLGALARDLSRARAAVLPTSKAPLRKARCAASLRPACRSPRSPPSSRLRPAVHGVPAPAESFAVAPIPKQAADGSFFTSDRVDLQSFSSTKHSDRILFRVEAPEDRVPDPLRLREATFNRYRDGRWVREGMVTERLPGSFEGHLVLPSMFSTEAPVPRPRPRASLKIESSSLTPGFLFVPYGTVVVNAPGSALSVASDGTLTYSGAPTDRGYGVEYVPQVDGSGPGRSSVPLHDVPPEIVQLAHRVAAGGGSPEAVAARLLAFLGKGFVYRIDVPEAVGDPVVDFLTRTRAGHCEYFASALALMLRSEGIPSRLVTGSLGGELGPLSSQILVRGDNLHAWVEASFDGRTFRMLDPTPAEGRPGIVTVSLWRRIGEIGNEIEYFYDRNILGFSTLEQVLLVERARDLLARVDRLGERMKDRLVAGRGAAGVAAAAGGIAVALAIALRRRRRLSPATRAISISPPCPSDRRASGIRALRRRDPRLRGSRASGGASPAGRRDLPGRSLRRGGASRRRASCAALSASFRESPRRFRS